MRKPGNQSQGALWFITTPTHLAVAVGLVVAFVVIATVIVGYRGFNIEGKLTVDELSVGDVAPMDIVAPRDSSFESAVLTEQQRLEEAAVVRNVYTTDNDITRRQVNRARLVIDYITHVRNDPYATPEQKRDDLSAIDDLALSDEAVEALLSFSDSDWARVGEQTINVLGRIMSGEVREDNLQAVRSTVPRQVFSLPEPQVPVATELVTQLIRPNTFVDPEATEAARDSVRTSIPPVIRSFRSGQVVVSRGQVVSEADMEALVQLGLLHAAQDNGPEIAAALIAVLLSVVVVGMYISRFHLRNAEELRIVGFTALFFLLFLVLARMMIASSIVSTLALLYPAIALALLVTALAGPQLAILISSVLGLLVGIITGSVEVVALIVVGSTVGALSLRLDARLNAFFIAGTLAGVANAGVVLVFGLTAFNADVLNLLVRVGLGLANGVLSGGVALAGLFLLGSVFNVTTGLLLAELSRADHPLQQSLMREAPGTYQHSLMVANMAENAAEVIGANELLVRVGALYHDIGKTYNPIMFAENQHYGAESIHERLEPAQSAQYIIRHAPEGDKMARKYRLPATVRDFIWQHHGTTTVWYFLYQAIEAAGGDESAVNIADFTYPGPRPQSRENGILMLADSCESAMRANRPSGDEAIRDLVNSIVQEKINAGQLDESGLTLDDLNRIRESFVTSLRGVFHPRVIYPKRDKSEEPAAVAAPKSKLALPARQKEGKRREAFTGIELAAAEEIAVARRKKVRPSAGFQRAFVSGGGERSARDESASVPDDDGSEPGEPAAPQQPARNGTNNARDGSPASQRQTDAPDGEHTESAGAPPEA